MGKGERIRARHAAEREHGKPEQPVRRRQSARTPRPRLLSRRVRLVDTLPLPEPRPRSERPSAANSGRVPWRRPRDTDGRKLPSYVVRALTKLQRAERTERAA